MIDRSSNIPGDSAPERQSELACSFCGKGRDKVRALITGPQVCICDECVALCDEILEKKYEPLSVDDRASSQRAMFNLGADCALCHQPTPIGELLPIPERGFLCIVCLEAVRLAADESEST